MSNEDVKAISTRQVTNPNRDFIGSPRSAHPGDGQTFASPVRVMNRSRHSYRIVSLREIGRNIVGMNPTKESTLWNAGLPIIFVINDEGKVLFHPDPSLVAEQRSLHDLKIVQEWRESNRQVQSALVPFTAEYDGRPHSMIGAYSTVSFGRESTWCHYHAGRKNRPRSVARVRCRCG